MRTVLPRQARVVPAEAELVFEGIIYNIFHWQQELFDGTTATFEMLKRPDTVAILAILDNKLVVLQEEQPGLPQFISVPSGRHDREEETELQAAQRELLEETGLGFKTWKLLDVRQPTPQIERFVYFFLATDLDRKESPHPDPGERIEVRPTSFEEVKTLIENPRNTDLAEEVLGRVSSLQELSSLPEYRND